MDDKCIQILVGISQAKRQRTLGRRNLRCVDTVKIYLREIRHEYRLDYSIKIDKS
jgi:hypothetical protein